MAKHKVLWLFAETGEACEKVLLEIRDNDPRAGDDADATLDLLEARVERRRRENWDLDGAME